MIQKDIPITFKKSKRTYYIPVSVIKDAYKKVLEEQDKRRMVG